jgi:colanic acid/amylovoran biosynthesis protein
MNIRFKGGGFSNKGDEAMMLTVQRELTKRLPSTNFFIETSPRQLEEAYSCGLFPSASNGSRLRRVFRLASAYTTDRNVRRACRLSKIAAEGIARCGHLDGIVDFSGFNYSDEWGPERARRGLAWAEYCSTHNKAYICLPQAWGPFEDPDVIEAVKALCLRSSLLYARDRVSQSFLSGLMGADAHRIRIAPDIAFLFTGESPQAGLEALKSIGADVKDSRLVGIAPNMRVYERCQGIGAENEYIQLMIRIAEHCIRAWDASIILVPHQFCVDKVGRKDDRFLCGLIRLGVSYIDRCFTIRDYISAALAKAIESHLDLMIGSRFHSCVLALSSGVPAVALGWAHKYPELMELVGLSDSALVHTQFAERRVLDLLDMAWENRARSKTVIQEHLAEIRKRAARTFDDVAEALRMYN